MSRGEHTHQLVHQLVTAPLGWAAVDSQPKYELEPRWGELLEKLEQGRLSVYDIAYVEPIPCFALVERWDCQDEHHAETDAYVPAVSPGVPEAWITVVPVLRRENYHFSFSGVDEYSDAGSAELVLGPNEDPDTSWVLKRLGAYHLLRNERSKT